MLKKLISKKGDFNLINIEYYYFKYIKVYLPYFITSLLANY
jgi:hypothetical protein